MKPPRSIYRAMIALGLAGILPAAANAAILYDEITVKNARGVVFASVSATPAEIIAQPNTVFYVSGVAIDPNQIGNYGMVVDNNGNALEIFGIGNGGPDGYDLSFGGAGAAAGYFPQYQVPDTGAPIDLTTYLDPGLQLLGDTATLLVATTGAPPNPSVPEPLTWAMMVLGFGAIGSGMRRTVAVRKLVANAR